MKLNHLNLTVTDVLAAGAFLEKYFGMRSNRGEGDRDNKNFVVMFDDNGLVLTLMKASHSTEVKYPGNFHIGFIQASEEQVNELNQRLKADGFDVEPPQHHHAWTFYVNAPGGFTVEVLG
ncbi:MAG TPA: VOC family protein [Phototrophicaceae bacterium]|jgi:catechol 2,3-dioxygenase-like lactoylglutathione lyase family enzyme|nr:VOC family protein [Phototrophicaceae bacterium]